MVTCHVSRPRVPTLVHAGPGVVLAGGGGHDVLGVEAVAQHQAPEPDTAGTMRNLAETVVLQKVPSEGS